MNKGWFTSERLKGNQYSKGNPPNQTSFKENHQPFNFKGVGVPRILKHSRDGMQEIVTIKDEAKRISRGRQYSGKKRTSYARFLMGFPKGKIVYHKDGNAINNAKNNLMVITRAELLKINQARRRPC